MQKETSLCIVLTNTTVHYNSLTSYIKLMWFNLEHEMCHRACGSSLLLLSEFAKASVQKAF